MHRLVSFVPAYDACEKLRQMMPGRLGPGSWAELRSGFLRNVKLRAVAAQLVWSGELPWAAARHEERPKALLG